MFASMHFAVRTSRWLQSVQTKLKTCSWKEFSVMVLHWFGEEQHEFLVRQLFHIRQTSSVEEYVDRFVELVDQLASHENNPNPLHYTMRFIDGLREDLRAAVLIQRPSDLDTTFVLAKLQEEVSLPSKRKDIQRNDFSYPHKQDVPAMLRADKLSSSSAKDRRAQDVVKSRSTGERWTALKAYRRAQGLCQNCAKKWSKDHICADKIQLHALQELLEVFHSKDQSQMIEGDSS